MIEKCPVCEASLADPFFEFNQVPVFCNVQYSDPDSAKNSPLGNIKLALCPNCNLIVNRDFDSSLLTYDSSYENALQFSPVFCDYLEQLSDYLTAKYTLNNKTIIEVGSGDGYFLDLLCRDGENHGIGFDPANSQSHASDVSTLLKIYHGEYDSKKVERQADLVVCRHLLEHISRPLDFLRSVTDGSVLKSRGAIYLEVPNARFTMEHLSVWDIIYEHCLYFSDAPMISLLSKIGAGAITLRTTFGEQFLSAELDLSSSVNAPVIKYKQELKALAERFGVAWENKSASLLKVLEALYENKCRIAIWGAGSKGVTFNNLVANDRAIKAFIDINDRKQYTFAPGTGLPILPPEEIKKLEIDTILIMNSNYQYEIENILCDLGIKANCIVV